MLGGGLRVVDPAVAQQLLPPRRLPPLEQPDVGGDRLGLQVQQRLVSRGQDIASDRDAVATHVEQHATALPPRGTIGIHNRSWYEEVLVARVHPKVLESQKLPPRLMTGRIWEERLEDIAAFERYLGRQGIVVLKFFLHVSRAEDLGGNRIYVQWFNENTNLHRLWDDQLLAFQQLSYTEFARAINHTTKADRKAWQEQPMTDWFWESYSTSQKLYKEITQPDQKLGFRYNFDHVDELNQCLLKAGVRLAGLLNAIFG
ncbi:MAG: hypothetical protein B7Z54_05295 [Sphingobacteriales bacterium 12-47-4]|nr:MAG: hypothetical protein B7Z54_05295 [Sphingobacteriales bacterium 12-47-4]